MAVAYLAFKNKGSFMNKKTAKKNKPITETPIFRIILTLASIAISILVLSFSALVIYNVAEGNTADAPIYLLWIFVFIGLLSVVVFLKDRTKINAIKCVTLIVIDIILGIIALFADKNPFIFSLIAGIYCVSIIVSRVFNILANRSIRSIILNGLVILLAVLIGTGMIISPTDGAEQVQQLVTMECVFIAVVSFMEAMSVALMELKIKVLLKIVVSTFSLEVLLGLLIMMVAFSFILAAVEPQEVIGSFTDGLWYCFAIVTTIGFGDIVATTAIGRILTVILGIYGLIVVAVITSIIVNFYNETVGKQDQKELKEIQTKEKENRK